MRHTDKYDGEDSKKGFELAENGMFDVVSLDVNLLDANGLGLIKIIKLFSSSSNSSSKIIIITGESDPDGAEMAINSCA